MRILIVGMTELGYSTKDHVEARGNEVICHDRTRHVEALLDGVECVLICLPTPRGALGYNSRSEIYRTADWLDHCDYNRLVGVRSTVIMGTCDEFAIDYPHMTWFSWPDVPGQTLVGVNGGKWDLTTLYARLSNVVGAAQFVTPSGAEFVNYAERATSASTMAQFREMEALAKAYGITWHAPPVSDWLPAETAIKDIAALLFHAARDKGVELPLTTVVHDVLNETKDAACWQMRCETAEQERDALQEHLDTDYM